MDRASDHWLRQNSYLHVRLIFVSNFHLQMHILIIPTKKHRSNVRPYWWGKN
uniref:Uncharacterized protein n=1 Tax=Manihot esculenta TaxID=3983 RepID=A0A2C9V613_MANES